MTEQLQVVNENDQPIGVATREEAWAKKLILRNVFMVLRDSEGHFLLQQRSLKKKAAPGLWTFAASGHVDVGEEYDTAATRELFEEIGIKTNLTTIGKTHLTLKNKFGTNDCFTTVYVGEINRGTPLTLGPDEVETTGWFSPDQLANLVANNPETLSPKLISIYKEFFS